MNETQIIEVANADWHGRNLSVPRETLLAGVERGKVLYFPNLRFAIEGGEQALLDPALADPNRKNISLEPNGGALHGVAGDAVTQSAVRALIARYQANARTLVDGLFPEYNGRLRVAPTSLRLHQVETRETSWRKDDSRLHVDAFPSRPNYGERILRVFTNVNPHGAPRVWRVGEPFEDMAKRFLPRIKPQMPGSAWLLNLLHVTKSPQRVRPSDAESARRHESRSRVSEVEPAGNHAVSTRQRVGVFLGSDFTRGDVRPVHAGADLLPAGQGNGAARMRAARDSRTPQGQGAGLSAAVQLRVSRSPVSLSAPARAFRLAERQC